MRAQISLLLAAAVLLPLHACRGRDPIEPIPQPAEGEGEGEGEEAVRTLTQRQLFGDLPTGNRVLDPTFGLASGAWYGFTSDFQMAEMLLRHLPQTPSHHPAAIEVTASRRGAIIIGQVKTTDGPLHASVWIGRLGDVNPVAFSQMDISVSGVSREGASVAFSLRADESSLVVLDGKTWMRFSGLIDEGGIGWSMINIYDSDNDTFLINGPVVIDQGATPPSAALRTALRRKPTALEDGALAAARARMRDQLTAPPPLHGPGVPLLPMH